MITVLTGDNSYEIDQALQALMADFDGAPERIDGTELELRGLADLVAGATLFADKRLVIMKGLAENKAIWPVLADWIARVSDDVHLVLVDSKLDKRTLAYKELKKQADVREFATWTDRDISKAEQWLDGQAKQRDLTITRPLITRIVRRVGADQWQLSYALDTLSLVDEITAEVIDDVIPANPSENVFNLFDTALRGDRAGVSDMIRTLELTEEPYRLFALLASQVFQLAAVASGGGGDAPSKDFGIHPYVAGKLQSASKKLTLSQIKKMVEVFARADDDMKLSRGDPWLLIERALLSI